MHTMHRAWCFVMWFTFLVSGLRSQEFPRIDSLNEVIVSGIKSESWRQSSIHVSSLSLNKVKNSAVFNITDALANIAGVSQFSTGPAISKPVIRGLYGNRILVLLSGIRLDNQQWQDEHGLGLTDIGLEKVEVIKGPLSILHGSEAVGGVINLIPEKKANLGTRTIDAGTRIQSNTRGILTHVGLKENFGKWWYGLRIGQEQHADYSDGNYQRVLNSRFNGYYAMANFGFAKKRWLSENHYNFSNNNFGFIFSDLSQFLEPDVRSSYRQIGPHHVVRLHTFSSENTFQLPISTLKVNVGMQSNLRQENEGGNKLTLQMQLLSGITNVRWIKPLTEKTTLIIANNSSIVNNTNFGSRKIVPDAWMTESSLSAYLKHNQGKFMLEYGAGAGWRNIKTMLTSGVNTNEKDIDPFTQDRYFANGLAGVSWNPSKHWNIKYNSATGVRAPNLAELSSNGLHEGIYTYELGDPNLKNEQNWNNDLTVSRIGKYWHGFASLFYNAFQNYIYLMPTEQLWYGFPVFDFVQDNASIKGGEMALYYEPRLLKGLTVGINYSGLVGKLRNGNYLPYMPAQKYTPSIHYSWNNNSSKWSGSFFTNMQFIRPQSLTSTNEKPTAGYQLFDVGIELQHKTPKARLEFGLTAKNLFNEVYYDHMSRLKTYNIQNIGRNFVAQLIIVFEREHNSSKTSVI